MKKVLAIYRDINSTISFVADSSKYLNESDDYVKLSQDADVFFPDIAVKKVTSEQIEKLDLKIAEEKEKVEKKLEYLENMKSSVLDMSSD